MTEGAGTQGQPNAASANQVGPAPAAPVGAPAVKLEIRQVAPLDLGRLHVVPRGMASADIQRDASAQRYLHVSNVALDLHSFETLNAQAHKTTEDALLAQIASSVPEQEDAMDPAIAEVRRSFKDSVVHRPARNAKRAVRVATLVVLHAGLSDMLAGLLGVAAFLRPRAVFNYIAKESERRKASMIELEEFVTKSRDALTHEILDRWWQGVRKHNFPRKLKTLMEILPRTDTDRSPGYDLAWVHKFHQLRNEAVHGDVSKAYDIDLWETDSAARRFFVDALVHVTSWKENIFRWKDRDCFEFPDI